MRVGSPLASEAPMKATCAGVKPVNVCPLGITASGNVKLEVAPPTISPVKKPDSCLRLCSNEKKKKVRSFLIGPPIVAPYWPRVNGGFLFGSLSIKGAKAFRD